MARRKQTTTRTTGGRAQRRREQRAGEKTPPATSRAGGGSFIPPVILPAILVLAGIVVYANSVGVPFVFDDQIHIVQRTDQIDQLWPPSEVLSGSFRPVVQYSLAINYAISRLEPASYHVVNIIIHILAGLTLFGVIRQTALRVIDQRDEIDSETGRDRERVEPNRYSASMLAFVIAVLWMVHPLQTQAVTYVIQRGESLASLFYLLTIYCAIRGNGSDHRLWWWAGAIASCGLGMGSKAIVMTAPIAVLLWDTVFTKPPLRATILQRLPLYGGLAASWLTMIFTGLFQGVMRTTGDAANIGFSVKSVTPLEYLFSQPAVLLHYLKLTFWPHPLVIDYEWEKVAALSAGILPGMVIAAALACTMWAVIKRHWAGFAGAMFFLVLAPTSSFVPLKDLAFEHRMYLPLASVLALAVTLAWWTGQMAVARAGISTTVARASGVGIILILAVLLVARTVVRNSEYHDPVNLWESVVVHRPNNSRARVNFGNALKERAEKLAARGAFTEAQQAYVLAINHLRTAYDARPADVRDPRVDLNLGGALYQSGQHQLAADVLEPLVERQPEFAMAWYNLGQSYRHLNRPGESAEAYRRAFELRPDMTVAGVMYGNALVDQNRIQESVTVYRQSIANAPPSIRPRELAMAHYNLGNSHLQLRQPADALREYRRAKEIVPDYPNIDQRIATAQAMQGGG